MFGWDFGRKLFSESLEACLPSNIAQIILNISVPRQNERTGTSVGMPRNNVQLFRACYMVKRGSAIASGARRRDWEEHPRAECQQQLVIMEGEVRVTWGGGDPAGRARRVRGTVDLSGAASVDPIESVRVLIGPEFLAGFLINGLAEGFCIFT